MRQVQTDFIDAVTFRYDDETRRNLVKTFSRKETLLDADLLEEHLVNQPVLGCIILLLAFFALFSLIFAIVFVACRALGNCGAKRYQAHPTSARRYFFHVGIFVISWIAMAVSASFFIQSGAAIWNPKIPIDLFDLDHTVIKRNVSVDEQVGRVRARRAVQETVTKRPISVFDLFADGDYLGDFEVGQTDASSTTAAAFVTATFPEENPIPIVRTNKTVIRTTDKNIARTRQQDKDEGGQASSAENEDIPPAVDRLPIRPITEESSTNNRPKPSTTTTEASTSKHFEIPVRPRAELDYGKQFEQGGSFVSNLWNGPRLTQAAAEMPHIRQSKLQIQPIVPDNERGGWTTTPVDNDIEEEVEVDSEELSGEVKPSVVRNNKEEPTPRTDHPPIPTRPHAIPVEEAKTVSVTHAPVHQENVQLTPEEEILSNEQQDSEPIVEEKPDVITGDNMPTGRVQFPQFNAQLEKSMEIVGSSETNDTSIENSTPETTTILEEVRTSMATTAENINTTTTSFSTSTTLPLALAATDDGSVESLEENTGSPDEKQEDLLLSGSAASETTTTAASTTTSLPTPPPESTPATTEDATTMETTVTTTESTTTTTTTPVPVAITEDVTTVKTSTEDREHIEMVTIPVTEGSSTTEGRKPLPIATEENVDGRPVMFVPIAKSDKEEEWKPVTDNPKAAATLAIFPSVPLAPETSHGKVEQLATPLLYPYRLLHTVAVVWIARLTLIIVGLIMIVVTLPSLALVLMGSFFYKSTQHPIDRKRTSDQIGQLVVILATFLLFALPLLLFFVQVTLAYHHLHNAICPSIQLKYQQDLGIIGPISSLTPESRDIVLRNVVNRDNCQASEAPVETMWLSCLCFAIFSIPLLVSLFKLSKYYLRMKTEYYWSLNDNYGTIYAKREPSSPGQDIYGNIYGTVNPRRPTSRPPPVPSTQSETVSYADGPVYTDGPIYGVYQAYGRL